MENGHFYTPIKFSFLFLNVCTQLYLQNDIPIANNIYLFSYTEPAAILNLLNSVIVFEYF